MESSIAFTTAVPSSLGYYAPRCLSNSRSPRLPQHIPLLPLFSREWIRPVATADTATGYDRLLLPSKGHSCFSSFLSSKGHPLLRSSTPSEPRCEYNIGTPRGTTWSASQSSPSSSRLPSSSSSPPISSSFPSSTPAIDSTPPPPRLVNADSLRFISNPKEGVQRTCLKGEAPPPPSPHPSPPPPPAVEGESKQYLLWLAGLLALFNAGLIDAGYSGDWSRIGAITIEQEAMLRLAALIVGPPSAVGILFAIRMALWGE